MADSPRFVQLTLTSNDPVMLNLFAVAYVVADGSGSKIYLLTGTNDSITVKESVAALSNFAGTYLLTRPSPVPSG